MMRKLCHASIYLNKLRRELERRAFKAQILGGAGEDVAVVDVDDVALVVQQDVPVVAIFNL